MSVTQQDTRSRLAPWEDEGGWEWSIARVASHATWAKRVHTCASLCAASSVRKNARHARAPCELDKLPIEELASKAAREEARRSRRGAKRFASTQLLAVENEDANKEGNHANWPDQHEYVRERLQRFMLSCAALRGEILPQKANIVSRPARIADTDPHRKDGSAHVW